MESLVIYTDAPKSNDGIVLYDTFGQRLSIGILVDNRTKSFNIDVKESDVDRIIEYLQNYKREFYEKII